MLPLTLKGKEAAFAMVLMAVDSQLRKRDIEGACDNPYPHNNPKQWQPRQRATEEMHKNCDKDAEV